MTPQVFVGGERRDQRFTGNQKIPAFEGGETRRLPNEIVAVDNDVQAYSPFRS
jgi:hypothetical protein